MDKMREPLTDEEIAAMGYDVNGKGWKPRGKAPEPLPDEDEQSVRDRRSVLDISDAVEVFRRVDAAGPPTWLVRGLWPADAYGVLGAEDKAGKTWTVLDLAVSVATGTPWLGHFECSPGPVLAFLGEGGERNVVRRLRAILASRGLTDEVLEGMLRLCFRVPHLTDRQHLERVRAEVREHPPVVVTLDPLYLAAPGGKGSDLYAMGEALGAIQSICQDADSALTVMTHWNKTGTGSGAQRFTGVGPGAWGRVLGSAAVERRTVDEDGTSDVLLRWEFTGGEIADVTFRCRRRVRAEDPDDLESPLSYSVDVTEAPHDETDDGLSRPQRRVFAALEGPDRPLGVREIGDRMAEDGQGPPLRRDTIQKALGALLDRGLVDADKPGRGERNGWWRT